MGGGQKQEAAANLATAAAIAAVFIMTGQCLLWQELVEH